MRNEGGAAAVEFALLLPVLILLVVGIVQFGMTFFQWLEIVHAAREGARWASLENPVSEVRQKVIEAAPGLKPQIADGDIAITVNGVPVADSTTIDMAGQPVKVTVAYDSPVFAPGFKILGDTGFTIRLVSSATQKIE